MHAGLWGLSGAWDLLFSTQISGNLESQRHREDLFLSPLWIPFLSLFLPCSVSICHSALSCPPSLLCSPPPFPTVFCFFLSLYCVQLSLSLSLSCVLLWACLSRSLSLYTNPNRTLCMAALKAFPLVLFFFFLPTMPHVISGTPSLRNG